MNPDPQEPTLLTTGRVAAFSNGVIAIGHAATPARPAEQRS